MASFSKSRPIYGAGPIGTQVQEEEYTTEPAILAIIRSGIYGCDEIDFADPADIPESERLW
jgi:hypothetical protein